MKKRLWYSLGMLTLVGLVVWFVWPPKKTLAPSSSTANVTTPASQATTGNNPSSELTVLFSTADLPERDPSFNFSIKFPKEWRVEYVATEKAINVYQQSVTLGSTKTSQLYITTYTGSTFATPPGTMGQPVQTHYRADGAPLQTATVAAPPNPARPSWWSEAHQVITIETSSVTLPTFTVFAFAPSVTTATMSECIASLQLNQE